MKGKALLGLWLVLITACTPVKVIREIRLPSTPVLAVESRWGVVTTNYLRLRASPSKSADVLDGLTKGTVVEVISSSEKKEVIEDYEDYWYRVNMGGVKGWIFGAYIDIRETKDQAQRLTGELQ